MRKIRVGTGLVLSLLVVGIWFLVVPVVAKHFPHPPTDLRLIIGVLLGEAGIVIALIIGMLTDGIRFRFPLPKPDGKLWIDGLSIPVGLIWHLFASALFTVIYFIISGHQVPTASPINSDFGTLKNMNHLILILTALLAAGLAAFIEEFFFRGYLISRLSHLGMNPLGAGVVAGILFALLHVPSYGLLVSMPKFLGLGLFAGLYVGWRGRLWPMIVAHFVIDFAGLLALGFLVVQ